MTVTLEAQERKEFRNSALRKIRLNGGFPAIIYGNSTDNMSVAVNEADFIKTIREVGRNGIISIKVNGGNHNVVLSDFQKDPIKNEIVHADFLEVDMSTDITADVRVVLMGECAGVKDGGVLQQPVHELSVTTKPNEIPQAIEIDVTTLQVGDAFTLGDLKGYPNLQINHDDELVLASILPPKQEEEINSGEEQEEGTPENEEGRETEASES